MQWNDKEHILQNTYQLSAALAIAFNATCKNIYLHTYIIIWLLLSTA